LLVGRQIRNKINILRGREDRCVDSWKPYNGAIIPIRASTGDKKNQDENKQGSIGHFLHFALMMRLDNIKIIRQNVYVDEEGCEDDRNASWR
jgi:hypothetical protein